MDIPLLGQGGLPDLGGIDKDDLENGPRDKLLIEDEVWRGVPDYEHLYEISSLGRVRSLPRRGGNNRIYGGKMLTPTPDNNGYPTVQLCDKDRARKQATFRVHELVASAFHGPRPEWAACIRHLDGNPEYNTPWNCVYGTDSENMHDTVHHGRHHWASKETCKYGHPLVQKKNQRVCPTCQNESARAYRLKKRGRK